MEACRALRDLLGGEAAEPLWRSLLHGLWLRNPLCSRYGAARWWVCRVTPGPAELVLPWRIAQTPQCALLRELSYRESYAACVLDRERAQICHEELISSKWATDFSGMATMLLRLLQPRR